MRRQCPDIINWPILIGQFHGIGWQFQFQLITNCPKGIFLRIGGQNQFFSGIRGKNQLIGFTTINRVCSPISQLERKLSETIESN